MLYTIHQPNFFPWLGYFDKVNRADVFIFFDHVQRPRGKSWISRVKINCEGQEKWLTFPIVKPGSQTQRICETEIGDPIPNYEILLNKLINYYRKTPYRSECIKFMEELYPESNLIADFNIRFTQELASKLGMNTTFYRSSEKNELLKSSAIRTEMIIETCKVFGVKDYLTGNGAGDFLDENMFAVNGVEVGFQNFEHPTYAQHNSQGFIAGLSIIDALMNCGIKGTAKLINVS